jgi:hypothetical protein
MNDMLWLAPLVLATDALLVWGGFTLARRRKAPPAPVVGVSADELRGELDTLRSAMEGLDDCLSTVDQAMRQRPAPPVSTPDAEPDEEARMKTYAIAQRLARKGADPTELIADCGLTRGEAELIHNLHGPRP